MTTKPEETEQSSPGFISNLATLFSPLILLALVFITTLVSGLGVVLIGRIITQVFALSLFEASLIALGVTLGVVYVLVQILRPQPKFPWLDPDWLEDDYDEDEDDFEDDEEFEDFPPAKSSLSQQLPRAEPMPGRNDPCWCGSGKKFKNCHGH